MQALLHKPQTLLHQLQILLHLSQAFPQQPDLNGFVPSSSSGYGPRMGHATYGSRGDSSRTGRSNSISHSNTSVVGSGPSVSMS
ncbi:hypothetical protein O3P69_007218 [Scylla paramamosain]|uniref:Uncharacterized protein n=1 Tax=Scylla paramamosain TaxID=85552 RepID=A0AAW0V4L4_SCYPA